jgi:hypothetical protein
VLNGGKGCQPNPETMQESDIRTRLPNNYGEITGPARVHSCPAVAGIKKGAKTGTVKRHHAEKN